MKNLILSAALALSSIAAPVAAHAGTHDEFAGRRTRDDRAVAVQPAHVRPRREQPAYATPVIAHRDDARRYDQRVMTRHEDGRYRAHERDAGRWQWPHAREAGRR